MATRSKEEIIADVERWAKERLANNEEVVYIDDRVSSIGFRKEEIKNTVMTTKKLNAVSDETRSPKPETRMTSSGEWQNTTDLLTLQSMISGCTKCELHKTRKNFVFGVGNHNAKVMVIGEAPGADEDEQGEPFVGRAGQLLNKMLLAIHFPREEVFIANILKSRPPGNRDPKPEEVAACEPYLWKQIELIGPKMILCVGRIAGTNLLKLEGESLAKMRGKVFDFMNAKVMVTYHPAALLRNPNWKTGAWEDLQQFRKLYDEITSDETH
jgi:uracil-DNA glycosylase family 4